MSAPAFFFFFVPVIFYAALGSWTYGAVRLADMFETKTREQDPRSGTSAVRMRGGGGGGGISAPGSSGGKGKVETAESTIFSNLVSVARPTRGGELFHRRASSRESPA